MANLRVLVLMLVVFSLGLHAFSASQTTPSIDWKALEDAWKRYVENPVDASLDQIFLLLPDKGKAWDNMSAGAPVIDLIAQGIGALEGQVYEKNLKAIRTTFRLFTISYGSFEERLARILGNLIGFDTLLFLQELQIHQNLLPNLELILASFRFGGTLPQDMEIERKYRIKMMESIKDKSVRDICNECMRILRRLKI